MLDFLLWVQRFAQNLSKSLSSVVKILVLSKKPKTMVKRSNDEAVILANGPSLDTMIEESIDFLNDKDLVCVNHFPSTEYFERLKPRYLISSAPDLWRDDIEPFYMRQSDNLFETLSRKTTWDLIFYFPFEARKYKRWQSFLEKNSLIKIVYYNTTPIEGWKPFRHWCFRHNLGMPRPHNVLIPSIFLLIN